MMDSTDARSGMEMEAISKSALRRKYDKEDDQILNAEHLQRVQKRSSFQAEGRRTSKESKININGNRSEDEDSNMDNIIIVKELEARHPTCNDWENDFLDTLV